MSNDNIDWFGRFKSAEEARKRYLELCKEYHPDNGYNPDEELMKEINAAWDDFNKPKDETIIETTTEINHKPKKRKKIKIKAETKNHIMDTGREFGKSLGGLLFEVGIDKLTNKFFKTSRS